MGRLANILERLPPVYRIESGSLLEQVTALFALQMAMFDADMDIVQRSHWVLHAVDRDDLAKIGALFDIEPADWESEDMYRARLVATIRGRLQGAVTRADLELVLRAILASAQISLGLRYAEIRPETAGAAPFFATGPLDHAERPAFVEFPLVLRRSDDLLKRNGRLRPLDHFVATNRGIDEAGLEVAITGVPRRRTTMPVIVNLTTGDLAAFAGTVRCGEILRLSVGADRALTATLDGRDVTRRVFTAADFEPGPDFAPLIPDPAPRAIRLARGVNELWFFSLALYDHPGADLTSFAMPKPSTRQGEFSETQAQDEPSRFDDALFQQETFAVADVFWRERQAASFRFDVPACAVLQPHRLGDEGRTAHAQLFDLLQRSVDLLRPAAVRGVVRARPFEDVQRASDRCRVISNYLEPEPASTGRDELTSFSALFDVSALDRARIE